MLPPLHNLSVADIGAHKRTNDPAPEPFVFKGKWDKDFTDLNFERNLDNVMAILEEPYGQPRLQAAFKTGEIENMHWDTMQYEEYGRDEAKRLDALKAKVEGKFEALAANPTAEAFDEFNAIMIDEAEDMEMTERSPNATLWNLMKDVLEDVLQHTPALRYEWEGNYDSMDTHGYFKAKAKLPKKKKKRR